MSRQPFQQEVGDEVNCRACVTGLKDVGEGRLYAGEPRPRLLAAGESPAVQPEVHLMPLGENRRRGRANFAHDLAEPAPRRRDALLERRSGANVGGVDAQEEPIAHRLRQVLAQALHIADRGVVQAHLRHFRKVLDLVADLAGVVDEQEPPHAAAMGSAGRFVALQQAQRDGLAAVDQGGKALGRCGGRRRACSTRSGRSPKFHSTR